MSQSALKKIAALRRCGGLLSRLAYERGRKAGIDVEVLLRQARLTPREIKNKDIRLGVQNQIKFVESVANATSDRLLGFHLAYFYDLREIGLLYYVIASAETLLGSLLRAARYSTVANDGIDLKIIKGNLLRVRLHYSGVARHSDVHQIEFWMASLVRICGNLIGANFKPIQIRIMHDRREQVTEMEKILGCGVKSGADFDEIIFPGKSGEYPIVAADPYLNRLCTFLRRNACSSRKENQPIEGHGRECNRDTATAPRNECRCSCCATWHEYKDAESEACVRGAFFSWNIRWLSVGLSPSLFGRKRDADFRNRLAFGVF